MSQYHYKDTWPPIWIGSETDHTIPIDKVAHAGAMAKLLDKHLPLSTYGTAITGWRFILSVVKPTNQLHPDDAKYARRQRRLTVWRNIDYQQALEASEEEFIRLVALKLLATILEIPDFGICSFDHLAFHRDVARILEAEGWIKPTNT